MKLSITKRTESVEEVDIELPAYFERHGLYIMVKDDGSIVKVGRLYMGISENDNSKYYRDDIEEALSSKRITESEFKGAAERFASFAGISIFDHAEAAI